MTEKNEVPTPDMERDSEVREETTLTQHCEQTTMAMDLHKIYKPNDNNCSFCDSDWRAAKHICDIIDKQSEQIAILQDEYTCEECETSFVDAETGIMGPSMCLGCCNKITATLKATITKQAEQIKAKDEALLRIVGVLDGEYPSKIAEQALKGE